MSSASKSSPCAAPRESSSRSAVRVRAKSLGLHESNIPAVAELTTAPVLDSDAPDSCHKLAVVLLRTSRNELDATQERVAALTDKHATTVSLRERGEVDLGPLRDWAVILREMIREKGPVATNAFMASFIEAVLERDKK